MDLAQPQQAVKIVKGILVTDVKPLCNSVTKGDAATSGVEQQVLGPGADVGGTHPRR